MASQHLSVTEFAAAQQRPAHPMSLFAPWPAYARIREACKVTGYSRARLYRLAGAGQIRFVKDGKATLVDMSTVAAHQANLPTADIRTAA